MKVLQLTADYLPKPLWGMGWHVQFLVHSLLDSSIENTIGTAYKSKNAFSRTITTSKSDDKLLSNNQFEIFNDFSNFNSWQTLLADRIIHSGYVPDIIHCHNWMSWLTTKAILKRYPDVKTVVTFHLLQKQYELMTENPIPTFHQDIVHMEEDMLKSADSIIVLSDSHLGLLNNKYSGAKYANKTQLLPGGVDFKPKGFTEIIKTRGKNPFFDVIFVGRLEEDKGIRQTLEAFTQLRKSKMRLHIVGVGPLYKELKAKNSNSDIVFHGFVSRSKLANLLTSSSVFCMPSYSEALATTVLEAMVFGTVPIFTEGVTLPHIFDSGVCGLKTPLSVINETCYVSVNDISEKMLFLYENKERYLEMAEASYIHANANFTLEAMAKRIIKLYYSVNE